MNRYFRTGLASLLTLDLWLVTGPVEAATMDLVHVMSWLITAINGSMALITVLASMLLFRTAWEYRQRRLLYSSSNLQRLRRHRMIVSSSYALPEIKTRKAQWMGVLAGVALVVMLQGPWQAFVTTTLGPVKVSGSVQVKTGHNLLGLGALKANQGFLS